MATPFFALCFLLLIFGQTKGNFYGSHSASDHAISTLEGSAAFLKREKRESDFCVLLCASDMLSNVDSHMPELWSKLNEIEEEKEPSYADMFTEYQFRTYCTSIFEPFDQCLDQCQVSQSHAIWKARLAPLKYMCVDYYSEFYNSLPCRRSVRNETVTKCLDDVCQQRKNAPIHLRNAVKNFKFTEDIVGLKYYLAENCKLFSCVAPCEDQIIEDKCGWNVMKLIRNYSKVYVTSIHKMYQLRGLSSIYPTECINMAEYHVTQTTRPKVDFRKHWYDFANRVKDLDVKTYTSTATPNAYDEDTGSKVGYWQNFYSSASDRRLTTLLILLLQLLCFGIFHFSLY